MSAREQLVYFAKLAEQSERYDEMACHMRDVAEFDSYLEVEERNLLAVAYKNAMGSRRAAWRVITSAEETEKSKGNDENAQFAKEFRYIVVQELDKISGELLNLLETRLIVKATDEVSRVFYTKMQADYYGYVAEFSTEDRRKQAAISAKGAYDAAMTLAKEGLVVTDPIRLGLALNFSVFQYEVLNNPEEACNLASQAFEQAIVDLDNVSEESYKDSTLIMQLLRDNCTLWSSETRGQQ